jgi:hypothetical protein
MTSVVPNYSVDVQYFGQQKPSTTPHTVVINQEEFKHDTVVLTTWADDANADSYASGMPMAVTWGRPAVRRSFYGYVNHVIRNNNQLLGADLMARNSTTVVCVGASYPMKESGTQTWHGQTATQVVQSIADTFGLAANITPHAQRWPVLHMAGLTYWEFCVRLAHRIGYTFSCSGVQIVFKPRNTNPLQVSGLVAFYDYRYDPGSLPVFSPMLGANNPMGGILANRNLMGINPRTSQLIYATVPGNAASANLGLYPDTPPFDKTEHFTVRAQDDANTKIDGAGLKNQLYLTATAHAVGDPLIAQGSLVFVANANGSQNGLWFVTKCVQTVHPKGYSMNMELGRDSLGVTAQVSGITQIESPPGARLAGSTWVAA